MTITETDNDKLNLNDLFVLDYNTSFENPCSGNTKQCNNVFNNNVTKNHVECSWWTLDSDASNHMTQNKNILMNEEEHVEEINYANGNTTNSTHIGEIQGNMNKELLKLKEVLYVPDIKRNLISISKLARDEYVIVFIKEYDDVYAYILDKYFNTISKIKASDNDVFEVCIKSSNILCNNVNTKGNDILWHRRIGHLTYGNKIDKCEICMQAKMKNEPYGKAQNNSRKILELVHIDLVGPAPPSIYGNCYFVTILDDYSRYGWVLTVKKKSEVYQVFETWYIKIKNKTNSNIIYLRSDNGTEFTSNNFKEICNKYGITQQFTVPGNPQQNGRAERLNGVLIQIATAMLIDSQLCRRFWEDALKTANYVHNRVPHHGNNNKIPFEVFYEKKVDNSKLHVFGCKVYYYEVNPEKFRSNSRKGIFLGYDEDSTGYRIFDIDKMKIYVKRVVEFLEDQPGNFNFDYVSETRRYENEETETQDEDTLMKNLEERNYYNRNDIINIIQENKEIEEDPQEENNEENRSQRDNNNERTVKEDIVNLDMQDIPNNSKNDINKDKEEESLSLSQKEKEHLENKFKLIEEKLET